MSRLPDETDILATAVSGSCVPRESTPMVLHYLHAYAGQFSNKKQAIVSLLRCSPRTATRLLSKTRPYNARMKLVWVCRICEAVGLPLSRVLQPRLTKTCRQALAGWTTARTLSEAMHLASDCALSICLMAHAAYGFRGQFSLRYDAGWPTELVVELSPVPEFAVYGPQFSPHHLVVTLDTGADGVKRMFLHHHHPTAGRVDRQILSLEQLERTLKTIHALTRTLTEGLDAQRS